MDQLLVALDVENGDRALALAENLRGIAGGFKIGSRLFTVEGPSIVRALTERGDRVFLDFDATARQGYEQRAQAAQGVVEGPDKG